MSISCCTLPEMLKITDHYFHCSGALSVSINDLITQHELFSGTQRKFYERLLSLDAESGSLLAIAWCIHFAANSPIILIYGIASHQHHR